MRKLLILVIVILAGAIQVSAQTDKDIKQDSGGKSMVDSRGQTPQVVIGTLRKYPDLSDVEQDEHDVSAVRQISYEYAAGSKKIAVVRVGAPTTYLKPGLTTKDVLQVLGEPASISKRTTDGLFLTTYEFRRGGERVLVAEFLHDKLIHSRTETRDHLARANR